MSLLDVDLSDAKEPTPLPDKSEALVRIESVTMDINKNGDPYVLPLFSVPEEGNVPPFTKYLAVPTAELKESDPPKYQKVQWAFKAFTDHFGLAVANVDPEESWPGATAWCILGYEEDEEYGDKNYIRRYSKTKGSTGTKFDSKDEDLPF